MYNVFCLAFTIAFTLSLRAEEPQPRAEASAQAIAPYLSEQTIALVRLDLPRLSSNSLVGKLVDLVYRNRQDSEAVQKEARRWLGDFSKAGGKEIYVVVDLADLPSGPFVIVPLDDN